MMRKPTFSYFFGTVSLLPLLLYTAVVVAPLFFFFSSSSSSSSLLSLSMFCFFWTAFRLSQLCPTYQNIRDTASTPIRHNNEHPCRASRRAHPPVAHASPLQRRAGAIGRWQTPHHGGRRHAQRHVGERRAEVLEGAAGLRCRGDA